MTTTVTATKTFVSCETCGSEVESHKCMTEDEQFAADFFGGMLYTR